jgi:RHS repeat-associated protein
MIPRLTAQPAYAYAYGPFGPLARTQLDTPSPCVRWLISDGRGNTNGAVDAAGNFVLQYFDAFGVPEGRMALATTDPPTSGGCAPSVVESGRARTATGELGYHGQEGYKTPLVDMTRQPAVETVYPPTSNPDYATTPYYSGYDPHYPDGYQTPSTGLLQVGARDYDPAAGRWLQPDPIPAGAELQWGQNNRWAYCANDPVNSSDPTGLIPPAIIIIAIGAIIGALIGYYFGGATGAIIGAAIGGLVAAAGAWLFAEALLGGTAAAASVPYTIVGKYVWGPDGQFLGELISDKIQAGWCQVTGMIWREIVVRTQSGQQLTFRWIEYLH